ncbi:MAG: DegT/DnrJ/EryC1/StrS family aminotransferase [Anaerolineae bacterium]
MIPVTEVSLGPREREYVLDCLDSGWISSLGKYVGLFEEGFSRYCGVHYGVATSNGTTALHLALATLGIGPDDEVIVPTLTFVATVNAVTYTGARPLFIDSEPETWNLDPGHLEKMITPRTRAIIPVHLYGHPVDMDPVRAIAARHGLYIIEDAAEAHGAQYKGRKAGSLSHLACFSFYGNKIITTGEGGMVITDDKDLAQRAAWLRDQAMDQDRRYWHAAIGYNYRLTNVQAAIGLAQLERIEEFVVIKRKNAALYTSLLGDVPGITTPGEAPWARNVYWLYSILVDEERYGMGRDQLAAFLREKGVDTRPFFHPVHTLPPYRQGQRFPVAERLARQGLSLPSAVTLKEEEIELVANLIRRRARQ